MSDKIYCGNGKEKTFDNGGSIIEVRLDLDALANNYKEHGFATQAGKRTIKVKICKSREVDQWGNTHYVEIDTWKPAPQGGQQQGKPSNNTQAARRVFNDDIPF